jgi:hypothetical protein
MEATLRLHRSLPLLASVMLTGAFVVFLCLAFEPRWETNDDVAMSMAAHGYGIAAVGTPNLVFSNVIWGNLVRLIPEINGILGYSIATFGVLITAGAAIGYGAYKAGLHPLAVICIAVLLLMRPALFPQFTVNAGLLTVAAVVCWSLYGKHDSRGALFAGCAFAFLSFLVRNVECLLVLLVALPLLPWGKLIRQRVAVLSGIALILAVAGATFVDRAAYQGPEWQAFNELHPARAPITDFGAGDRLKQRPDILERYGYSANDLDLIRYWFFVDAKVADSKTLNSMLKEAGLVGMRRADLANAWLGIQTLWHPRLLPLIIPALLLLLLRPNWRVAACWALAFGAFFVLGLLGRPGILRVYVPLACLLLLAPILTEGIAGRHRSLATGGLLLGAVFAAYSVVVEQNAHQLSDGQMRPDMAAFPSDPIVIWGSAFPYQAAYPVLGGAGPERSNRLYALGAFTVAPFTVASVEERAGRGLVRRLLSPDGVPIIADGQRRTSLQVYCEQHWHGRLKELSTESHRELTLTRFACEANAE